MINLPLDAIRQRFHELGIARDDKLAKSIPLREHRDQIANEMARRVNELNEQIGAIEEGLFEIDQERAALSRALGGQTGEPVA
jgi:hypothetical protein